MFYRYASILGHFRESAESFQGVNSGSGVIEGVIATELFSEDIFHPS
jgi:hypothetical protein